MGLRARVIASFAIGALLLSALLSLVVYSLTRSNLIDSTVTDTVTNAENHAIIVNEQLGPETRTDQLVELMRQVVVPPDTNQAMFFNNTNYYVDSFALSDDKLVPAFMDRLRAGQAAQMTFMIDDAPHHVVGLPLPNAANNASYIEAASLAELESSLNSLIPTLLGAATITTVLGAAFGISVSRRLLSPVEEIAGAASQIASGDLSTRLDSRSDPDLDQLVESFNGMTTALQERIERDSRFASDVSHELRSPLMTLTGSVAVLERRRDDMPERAQLALDLLSADIKRFKLLVEDLLEISRFDVGAVELAKEEVMFGEFVRQALGAAVGGQREIPIIHQGGTDEAFVEIDKRRIAQVIRNLSENADKYADGVTQVRLVKEDDDVRIEIEDEGPGVPVDERELIFERFARGSEGGRRGSGTGVGLGLSLVTEHLRLHGGQVWVTDRVDGLDGSRFVISLPDVVVE